MAVVVVILLGSMFSLSLLILYLWLFDWASIDCFAVCV